MSEELYCPNIRFGTFDLDIIGRDEEHIFDDTKKSCPYLDKSYEIRPKPYSFTVKNAFGQERQYDIFYHIVPPMDK